MLQWKLNVEFENKKKQYSQVSVKSFMRKRDAKKLENAKKILLKGTLYIGQSTNRH